MSLDIFRAKSMGTFRSVVCHKCNLGWCLDLDEERATCDECGGPTEDIGLVEATVQLKRVEPVESN